MKNRQLIVLFAALLVSGCLTFGGDNTWGNSLNVSLSVDASENIIIDVYENGHRAENVNVALRTFLGGGMLRNVSNLEKNGLESFNFSTSQMIANPELCQEYNKSNKSIATYYHQYYCELVVIGQNNGGRPKMMHYMLNFGLLNGSTYHPEVIPMASKCNRTLREVGLNLEGSCLQNSLTKNIDTTNVFLNGYTPKFIYFNCPSFRHFTSFHADWDLSLQQSQLSICTNASFVNLIKDDEFSQCKVKVLFANGWSDSTLTSIHVRGVNTTYAQAQYIVDPAPITYTSYMVNDTLNVTDSWDNATEEIEPMFNSSQQVGDMARLFGYDPELVKMWQEKRGGRRHHEMNGTRKRCNGSRNGSRMNHTGGWRSERSKNCTLNRMRMMNHWHRHEMRKMRRHWKRHQRRHHREGRHGGRHHGHRRRHHRREREGEQGGRRGGEGRRHRGWGGFPEPGMSTSASPPVALPAPMGPYPVAQPATRPTNFPYVISTTSNFTAATTSSVSSTPINAGYSQGWRNEEYEDGRGSEEHHRQNRQKKKKCFKLIMIGVIAGVLLCCVGLCLVKCCKKRCCCRRRHHHHGHHQQHPGYQGFEIVQPVSPINMPTDTQRVGVHPFMQPAAPTGFVHLA